MPLEKDQIEKIKKKLPSDYAKIIQTKLKEKGLGEYSARQIRYVVNGERFNEAIVNEILDLLEQVKQKEEELKAHIQ